MIESVEMKVSLGVGPCGPPHVFCIHLDNGTGPFYAGEVLSGHVLVQSPFESVCLDKSMSLWKRADKCQWPLLSRILEKGVSPC